MKIKSTVKTVKTVRNEASVQFDEMVLSTNKFVEFLLATREIEINYNVSFSEYLPDNEAVLKFEGEYVATIALE